MTQNDAGGVRGIVEAAAGVLGLAGYVYLIGGVLSWVRLSAAHLPADATTSILDRRLLFAIGFKAIVLAAVVFAVVCLLSYAAGRRAYRLNPKNWKRVIAKGPNEAVKLADENKEAEVCLGDRAAKLVAGFNVMVIAAVFGLAGARVIDAIFAAAWVPIVVFFVLWFGLAYLLARLDPLSGKGILHKVVIFVAVVVAAFSTAPIGVLVLASIAIARLAGVIARLKKPGSVSEFLRSPLPWGLLTIYSLFALAWIAIPPVSYTRAVITTPAGQRVGGYLARTGDGVWLVTCRGVADATSREEHTILIPSSDVKATTLGGEPFRVDQGDRPSLAGLAFRALGIDAHPPTWFKPDLRATKSTCGGEIAPGTADEKLGVGVLTGPPPREGRASGGEPTVDETSPAIAKLAKKYQPTVEVTIADRFWPVSVGAVLASRTAIDVLHKNAQTTCLVQPSQKQHCPPTLPELAPLGSRPVDYLDYPASLAQDPTKQFQVFARGQGATEATIRNWLSDPAALDPWRSGQVYFRDGGISKEVLERHIPGGFRALQYWFFYPYNYYPTAVARKLMAQSPIAADLVNVDLHEGDWEHVTVLLDEQTLEPRFLYMARHDVEGVALKWDSGAFKLDGTHPIVQASFGGHATYPNTCAENPRPITRNAASDWVVCGSGRFAFEASNTPLVDLARTPWGCWAGHFGQATPDQLRNARLPEQDPRRYDGKFYRVAGPLSPLRQAENVGTCR
jgi:Vacuolar protein sorting-associated protein 62